MSSMYIPQARELQDRFDTRRLADRIEELLVHDTLSEGDAAFISARDMFFLATVDGEGRPSCSYKGGARGFVRVTDSRTLVFPNYDGNGMYLSAGNMAATGRIGMLFIDFQHGERLRVNGIASLVDEDDAAGTYDEAQFLVRVSVTEVFPNCPRYIHRMEQVESSVFVPRPDAVTPVPDWKRSDWARDVQPGTTPPAEPGSR